MPSLLAPRVFEDEARLDEINGGMVEDAMRERSQPFSHQIKLGDAAEEREDLYLIRRHSCAPSETSVSVRTNFYDFYDDVSCGLAAN